MASLQLYNQPGGMVTKRQIRGAILPWEKQLIDTLGLTIEEYNWYANEVANYRPERDPAYDVVPEVQCTGIDPISLIAINLVVGIGASFASQALAPKPKLPKQSDPGQRQGGGDVTGASVSVENRFTNVDGFTSVQPLARLGESMQMVFANRRGTYGGVRVETKLLWSQLLSQGDGQELLAIFLANGGALEAIPDLDGIGIGDSLLRGYQSSKLALYFRNGNSTNRIQYTDRQTGELEPRNKTDVFMAELRTAGNLKPIFSGVRIPSTMTVFGISEPIRNGQPWRLPFKRVRVSFPQWWYPGGGADVAGALREWEKGTIAANKANVERYKNSCLFAARTGLRSFAVDQGTQEIEVVEGQTLDFHVYAGNSPDNFALAGGNKDVITKENAYRQSIDDVIVIGETYLVAGVESVCIKEDTQELWSDKLKKIYTFKCLQSGKALLVGNGIIEHAPISTYALDKNPSAALLISKLNPTYGPTVCKLAIGHFTTTRKLNQVEIGIKSQVWKRFSGMVNFASMPDEGFLADLEAGGNTFTFGTYSDYGLRYSFFRIEIREQGQTVWYRLVRGGGGVFCVKGRTPVDQFNFIRVGFPDNKKQYEIRFRPIAGGAYLAYNWPAGNPVCVLDGRTGIAEQYVASTPIGSFDVGFKGYFERLDRITSTNEVMFFGGKPQSGRVIGISPLTFTTDSIINEFQTFTTSGGSGTGLTVNALAAILIPPAPVADVVIGLQTRWLHMGIMGAPIPQYSRQEYTKVVRFTKGSHFVDAQFTLRAMTFAEYKALNGSSGYFGTGYGIDANNNEGWPYPLLWVNLNSFPSKVTIVAFDGFNVNDDGWSYLASDANGVYSVFKLPGFATPNNGKVQADINVTYIEQAVYQGSININDGGANYKNGDKVTVNGLSPQVTLTINSVDSPGAGASIAEDWDAVADVYLYDGQEGSHESGPEHQIVYINEQRQNLKLDKQATTTDTIEYAPLYEDMSLLGLQLRSGKEWSSFNNFTYYAKKGSKVRKIIDEGNLATNSSDPANAVYGASNLYPEILYHLISNSNLMPTTMVDWDGFAEACKVCLANNFYWDGVLAAPVNIRDWGTENAQYFFLDFLVLGGRLSLQPTFPVNKGSDLSGYTLGGAYNRLPLISALFTDGNIIEDSLQVSWYPAEQRKAPQILVTLRDEVENGFAETRNILVKRIDAANPNPQVEAIDFTGFCTSADHAIQFAKLLINVRYHVTHTITFKTLPSGLALQPGQYFRVSSQARHVEQFQNGYVLENGTVVSSSLMAAGTYTVYFWRSSMTQVEERSMVIGADGKTTPEFANSVFTQYNNTTSNRLYKAEMIAYDGGEIEITGSHVPVEADGKITYLNMDATLFEVQNEQ
jgi:hypothetical protein